jgi:2-polyprenyl-3-methyl-5-hydroxy-6-metoxy-1,4-benzoquinol methylase
MKPPVVRPDWPDEVKALYAHDVREMWDQVVAPHIWNQYHSQLDLYLAFCRVDVALDILDVGCAQGTLALLLAERGHRVTAIDIRPHFLDYARSRYERGEVRFLAVNAFDLRLAERFDIIFANQILEHTVYPEALVRTLRDHLKPHGRLVATTPNWGYFANRRAALPKYAGIGDPADHEHRQFTADSDGHFFAYAHDEFRNVLSRAGLTQVEVRHFESPWISGHAKIRHLHRVAPPTLLRALDSLTLRLPAVGSFLAHQLLGTGVRSE